MSDRFPRMTEYLSALPQGVASHPGVRSKASLIRNMEESRKLHVEPGELPPPCEELLRNPPPNSVWTPTAPFCALMLAYGDAHFRGDDDAFYGWIREISAQLYAKPLYRFLMYVSSPKQIVGGAVTRWHTFHQGTTAEILEKSDNTALIRFGAPPQLFSQHVVGTIAAAWEAAITAAGGKGATSELLDVSPTGISCRLRWQ